MLEPVSYPCDDRLQTECTLELRLRARPYTLNLIGMIRIYGVTAIVSDRSPARV